MDPADPRRWHGDENAWESGIARGISQQDRENALHFLVPVWAAGRHGVIENPGGNSELADLSDIPEHRPHHHGECPLVHLPPPCGGHRPSHAGQDGSGYGLRRSGPEHPPVLHRQPGAGPHRGAVLRGSGLHMARTRLPDLLSHPGHRSDQRDRRPGDSSRTVGALVVKPLRSSSGLEGHGGRSGGHHCSGHILRHLVGAHPTSGQTAGRPPGSAPPGHGRLHDPPPLGHPPGSRPRATLAHGGGDEGQRTRAGPHRHHRRPGRGERRPVRRGRRADSRAERPPRSILRHRQPRVLEGRAPQREVVLLAHQPRIIKEAARNDVGLVLSGHTHGGQIWPFSYLVYLQQPYVKGLHEENGTRLYLSSGTGFWGPPMRLGTTAEMALITLRAQG